MINASSWRNSVAFGGVKKSGLSPTRKFCIAAKVCYRATRNTTLELELAIRSLAPILSFSDVNVATSGTVHLTKASNSPDNDITSCTPSREAIQFSAGSQGRLEIFTKRTARIRSFRASANWTRYPVITPFASNFESRSWTAVRDNPI